MGRHWVKCAGFLAAIVAVALVVAFGHAASAETRATAIPAKLVGTWTRTVSLKDVTKSGGYGTPPGSTWTLIVKKSGAGSVNSPGGQPFTGKIVTAGSGRVHINLGNPVTNVYTWRVAGRALTFTKVKDA